MELIDFLSQPWQWYIAGPLIALVMFVLLYLGRTFGVSSTLRTSCTLVGAGRTNKFFDFDWRDQRWNLVFAAGAILGGLISSLWLANSEPIMLAANTQTDLTELGIGFSSGDTFLPASLFSWDALSTLPGIMAMIVGGFLVGFGARYAGGCTSGHGIMGLSNLQWPSLLAVIGFFLGGLITTHFFLPIIVQSL